ncbi:MAG: hypothetical protein M5U28_12915 [Sandaracinaceae bacterium]|nr:hypothetical protein [Sandaracinaceae bacterium]
MLAYLFSALPIFLTPGSLAPVLAQLDDADEAVAEADGAAADDTAADDTAEAPSPEEAAEAAEPDRAPSGPSNANETAGQLAQRAQIRDIHRAFGIATWISLAGTLVFGGIQLRDEYGPFASAPDQTPCFQNDAAFGGTTFCYQDAPVPHLVSALVSSVLYYTTFTLSFFMPDPLGFADSPGWAGERLRIHKILRWLHFGGMVVTSLFGAITANLDPTSVQFAERQALAITHFALGATTFALLSAAAMVILF